MDCIVHGVAKSWTRLSHFHFTGLRWLRGDGREEAEVVGGADRARQPLCGSVVGTRQRL